MSESEGQPLQGEELVKLVHLVRQALWGEGVRPEIRVEGVDETGLTSVVIISQDVAYRIRVPDVQALVALAGPRQQPHRELSDDKLPYAPRTSAPLEVKRLDLGEAPLAVVLAGPDAQAVSQIHTLETEGLDAAVFTSRGPTAEKQGVEYKPFNEDAVVLRARRAREGHPDILAVGVFDQAGGEGAVEGSHGAASAAAAHAFNAAVAKIEEGADPAEALAKAAQRGGDDVRALGVGAMTTFAGAVFFARREGEDRRCEVYVATVGDSRALLVAADGTIKDRTRLHNLGAAITAGHVVDVPKEMALQFAGVLMRGVGGDDDAPDVYRWMLDSGDRVVLETDGLGDARELEVMPSGEWHADHCAHDQGRLVTKAASAADGVKTLVGYALDQMADHYGKPDNLGVAVVRVR